jgi:hypothetical protein
MKCKTCGVEHDKPFTIPAHIMEHLELNKWYRVAGVYDGHKIIYEFKRLE